MGGREFRFTDTSSVAEPISRRGGPQGHGLSTVAQTPSVRTEYAQEKASLTTNGRADPANWRVRACARLGRAGPPGHHGRAASGYGVQHPYFAHAILAPWADGKIWFKSVAEAERPRLHQLVMPLHSHTFTQPLAARSWNLAWQLVPDPGGQRQRARASGHEAANAKTVGEEHRGLHATVCMLLFELGA